MPYGEVEIRDRWIEIKSLPDLELVTVIEILSPTNKSGEGRTRVSPKRASLIDRPVNLVEIDLLLSGQPAPLGKSAPATSLLRDRGAGRGEAGRPGLSLDDPSPAAFRSRSPSARPTPT